MNPFWKFLVFGLCLIPLGILSLDIYWEMQRPGSALGAEPGEAVVHWLGSWGIRFLLITLAVSSLVRLSPYKKLIRFRRMLGLVAFTYVVLHFSGYVFLLADGDLATIADDFSERPYITAGLIALLLLLPLAVTSTRGWQRRLGKNWVSLHKLIYPAAMAALVHLFWLAKSSYFDAFLYGSILMLLFLERFAFARRKSQRNRPAGTPETVQQAR